MGLLDSMLGKKEEKKEEAEIDPRYADKICAACNQPGADRSFGGYSWHKKCFRKAKRMAKGMV
jgi:hypothetical protein